jgi:Fe2+ or Zn2+ uptake regulation protein
MKKKVSKSTGFYEQALLAMKQAGLKLTKPRQQVLIFLAECSKAMTPYEIRDVLKSRRIKSDVVTIYRILEEFTKMGLVHRVMSLGRFVRCSESELAQHCEKDNDCHHYLICENCHMVEEIAGENLHELEQKIEKKLKFKIFSHSLEFLGLCAACQKLT